MFYTKEQLEEELKKSNIKVEFDCFTVCFITDEFYISILPKDLPNTLEAAVAFISEKVEAAKSYKGV